MVQENKIRILIVEDDVNLGYLLKENLETSGFKTSLFHDGEDGIESYTNEKYDLCILDIMLPKIDGFSVAGKIRELNKKAPIVFLTSKSSERDKIEGFKKGADDYVTKPFSFTELKLRIDAILKRTSGYESLYKNEDIYTIGTFKLDYLNRILYYKKASNVLSAKEADLLKLFFENPNVLLNRNLIMNKVWGRNDYFIAKSMDVYLAKLRKMLKADSNIEIANLYGTGFKLIIKDSES